MQHAPCATQAQPQADRCEQRCSCCNSAIANNEWPALPYVGVQTDGDDGWLELRNHWCGSTISRQLICKCGQHAAWMADDRAWYCEACLRAEWVQ